MPNPVFGRNARRILIAYERNAGRRFYNRPSVVRRCPRVTVGVRVDAYGGFDGVVRPEDRRVGKQIVLRKDTLDVSAIVAPFGPSLQNPCKHAYRGIAQPVSERTRIEHVYGEMRRETTIELQDLAPYAFRDIVGNRLPSGEIPGTITVEKGELLCGPDVDRVELVAIFVSELAGYKGSYIASPGGVLIVTENLRHEHVPKIGDLPEIHVRIVRQRRREPEARKRWHDHVEGLRGISPECAGVGKRIDNLGPMPKRPRPAVGQNQRNRVRSYAGLAHTIVVAGIEGPSGRFQPCSQICEQIVRHVDRNRFKREKRFCHEYSSLDH